MSLERKVRRYRALRTLSVAAIVAAPVIAWVSLSSGPADASSTTHKVAHFTYTNLSGNVPENAKVKFSCSSTTQQFSLKIANLNITESSGKSWVQDNGYGISQSLAVDVNTGQSVIPVPLTQNPLTGGWSVNASALLSVGQCQSGTQIAIIDGNEAFVEWGGVLS